MSEGESRSWSNCSMPEELEDILETAGLETEFGSLLELIVHWINGMGQGKKQQKSGNRMGSMNPPLLM